MKTILNWFRKPAAKSCCDGACCKDSSCCEADCGKEGGCCASACCAPAANQTCCGK
jgi:hypothetical protein